MYSQNNEDDFILAHFGDFKGSVVEIGANDGLTLSNSKLLIENGWEAYLFEPSLVAFRLLEKLHFANTKVFTYPNGISDISGSRDFYVSGELLGANDTSLVSCLNAEEMVRWQDKVNFQKESAYFVTWKDFVRRYELESKTFDVISIDAEGEDWNILQQINLETHNCKLLCVEWNTNIELAQCFIDYASTFGMKEVKRNDENIIFVK